MSRQRDDRPTEFERRLYGAPQHDRVPDVRPREHYGEPQHENHPRRNRDANDRTDTQ